MKSAELTTSSVQSCFLCWPDRNCYAV